MINIELDPQIEQRLRTERNIWLATVRPALRHAVGQVSNGQPHLVPIWFVWHRQKIYICTELKSVKAQNIINNPQVAVSLEDGDKPIVIEGTAKPIEKADRTIVNEFQKKYDWNIETDRQYDQLIEIEVKRMRA
jgi:F420H(2)-dependent biliverdin reductase